MKIAKKKIQEQPTIQDEIRFTKSKILGMSSFAGYADLLGALLHEDNLYTLQEVQQKISSFMKGSET